MQHLDGQQNWGIYRGYTLIDLNIDSLKDAFMEENEGETHMDIDFGLGMGGRVHEDTSTFGLASSTLPSS